MSLPNYLARIKSSGFYRFVWDKSVVQPQQAETLRLLVGYSEKGPFNTPVYIDNIPDFINTFGNISKRLEKKGVYFHRLALQALAAGPILALNLKPFNSEVTGTLGFDPADTTLTVKNNMFKSFFNTNRFWHIDADKIPENIENDAKYINIVNTDTSNNSCSVFLRGYEPDSYKGLTFRDWYASTGDEIPSYMDDDSILDLEMSKFFMEMYIFRGNFTEKLCGEGGALEKYFKKESELSPAAHTTSRSKQSEQLAEAVLDSPETYVIDPNYTDAFGIVTDGLEALANDPKSRFVSKIQGIILPYFKDANGRYISLDMQFNSRSDDHKMMMKLSDKTLDEDAATIIKKLTINKPQALKPYYINGYDLSITETGDKLVEKILKVLDDEKGIRTALTNRVDVEYHYIVDTFNTYSAAEHPSKQRLAALAKEKDNAFAIINMPSMSDFGKNETYQTSGKFDIDKIPVNYKLPSEVNGASWCAYFTQLMFADGPMKYYVPSAALVSNKFMDKYQGRQPYYIVAGPTYGVVDFENMIGPDYNYGRSDLDVLEPMGVNAIIYVPRKGTYINSNQTAKQIPISALSKIHVRELVIYLQNEIEFMLQNYQWELNTQTLRDTIKSKADYILDNIKNNGGIYEFNTVCDSTNNTPEVIDNEMVVIDIAIEPARGSGKMVQTLTIHKTGGISSSANI